MSLLLQSDAASQKDDWDDSLPSPGEAQAKIQLRQEGAAKRERALAYAISRQVIHFICNDDDDLISIQ